MSCRCFFSWFCSNDDASKLPCPYSYGLMVLPQKTTHVIQKWYGKHQHPFQRCVVTTAAGMDCGHRPTQVTSKIQDGRRLGAH